MRPHHVLVRGLVMLAALLIAAVSAVAQDVAIPSPPATTPAPGAAPAPTTSAPAASTPSPAASPALSVTTATPATLRIGSSGQAVRELQRELRRRGLRMVVDGAFGPATKRALTTIQRRLGLRPTGVANPPTLARLGLVSRLAAVVEAAPATPTLVAGTSQYLAVFPVGGQADYGDDFGDARSQGSHEGTDIMADRGTPLLAADNASVIRLSRVETARGGISLWLERADGTQYYYAHMTAIAAGLAEGSTVAAGEPVGSVGNTGDARFGAPHLHFEVHPGGGAAINPYPHLVAVDPSSARTQARARG